MGPLLLLALCVVTHSKTAIRSENGGVIVSVGHGGLVLERTAAAGVGERDTIVGVQDVAALISAAVAPLAQQLQEASHARVASESFLNASLAMEASRALFLELAFNASLGAEASRARASESAEASRAYAMEIALNAYLAALNVSLATEDGPWRARRRRVHKSWRAH